MINSLFWRIAILAMIPVAAFLVVSDLVEVPVLSEWHQANPIVFLLGCLILFVTFSAIIVNHYISIINSTIELIENPVHLTNDQKITRRMPPAISKLYKSMRQQISRLNEANNSLLFDKKMFELTLRNINDGIFIVDENEIVTLINSSACQIFKIGREMAIGHTLAEAFRNHRINELYKLCCASDQQETMSFEIPSTKTFIQCIATPLSPELPGSVLFLLQDLTRIRQLEIIRSDFVSNVSHELRTPLASLKLITETLQGGALDDRPAALRFLERMDSEVDNLTQIVEELLELSRIESGKVPLEKRWTTPFELIKNAGERMALQAERAGLSFSYDCDEQLPNIFIDAPRLERVLVNLLHNAIKFTNPGGIVELKASRKDNDIIFSIRDTGIGITPRDLERIFERFFKADRSRSDRGTGLGLSIARHLVEAHNGRIWAESEPNQGSTFYFSIPIY